MKNGIARSPLFYVGDKCRLIREIRTHFPQQIGRLIEPFVGGGSVMMNVRAEEYLLNDIDSYVIDIHRMLSGYSERQEDFFTSFYDMVNRYGLSLSFLGHTAPEELKREFPKTYYAKYNKEAYNHLRADFNNSDKRDMMMLYVLLIYGFNRMLRFNSSGAFNLPVGDVDFNSNTHEALVDYFNLIREKHILWHSQDFREFLSGIEYVENDLVYLDPPYLITFSEYNKLWNDDTELDLLHLLDELDDRGVHFAISNVTHYKGKTNEAFLEWSNTHNYASHPIRSNYISFNDNTIKNFNEVLVTNY